MTPKEHASQAVGDAQVTHHIEDPERLASDLAHYFERAIADEREACARLASDHGQFSDCDMRGGTDPETGEVPCAMQDDHGVCECAVKIEHGSEIAALIRARNSPQEQP